MHACMVAYTFYEYDNRVRRYAETLVRKGHSVDVIALREESQASRGELRGVQIYRIQTRLGDERGKLTYLYRLLKFLFRSSWILSRLHLNNPYDLVHVHSVPDFQVFSAFIPKLMGAKIILDIHDIVPEFYASKFDVDSNSLVFKSLILVERLSIAFSDHVIIANDIWRQRLLGRSVDANKCTTILNYPDSTIFSPQPHIAKKDVLTFLYPGTLSRHQGLDIAIRAFCKIKDFIPPAVFHIYGDGPETSLLLQMITELGLEDRVFIRPAVPMEELASIMSRADIGVVPKRNDKFGGEAFSTKILEFMCTGTPVIVAKTRIDSFYFNESLVMFFTPEDVNELADCMQRLSSDHALRSKLAENAQRFVQNITWNRKQDIYLNLVHTLFDSKKTP